MLEEAQHTPRQKERREKDREEERDDDGNEEMKERERDLIVLGLGRNDGRRGESDGLSLRFGFRE